MKELPVPSLPKLRYSLRFKLSVGLILVIGIIFAGQNIVNLQRHRLQLKNEVLQNRATVIRLFWSALLPQLADHDLNSPQIKTFLARFLTQAVTNNKKNQDLAFALVVDTQNHVLAGSAKLNLTVFPGNRHLKDQTTALRQIAKLHGKLGGHMRTRRINIQLPKTGVVGTLMVGTSLQRVDELFRTDLLINGIIFLGALALLVIYAILALGGLVIRPINKVMDAMRAVHSGDLTQEVSLKTNDEIGVLANTYNFMVAGLREREQLKDAFSRYVSAQVFERLNLNDINLTGEMRNATVLFSDIRSFTALSERLPAPDVVSMLNDYFNVMVEIVFQNEGFLNKFIGDAFMAVYNVPVDQTKPELRAVNTALQMIDALKVFNNQRAERGLFAVKIGVGINTGPVVAGNIGHTRRLEYTVIGDTVNLAQRIESQTKVTGMPILISETTYQAVANQIVAQALPPVKVKGKQKPVPLYAVTGLVDPNRPAQSTPPKPIPVPPPSQATP